MKRVPVGPLLASMSTKARSWLRRGQQNLEEIAHDAFGAKDAQVGLQPFAYLEKMTHIEKMTHKRQKYTVHTTARDE